MGYASQKERVTIAGARGPSLMDSREVDIGDRLRLISDTSTPKYETRTVDAVYEGVGPLSILARNIDTTTTGTFYHEINTGKQLQIGDTVIISGTDSAGYDDTGATVTAVTTSSFTVTFSSAKTAAATEASEVGFAAIPTKFGVSEPFSAGHSDVIAYNDGAGTTEAKVCSGRGLCDESTGECQCFAGYADVDCSVQNSLAL